MGAGSGGDIEPDMYSSEPSVINVPIGQCVMSQRVAFPTDHRAVSPRGLHFYFDLHWNSNMMKHFDLKCSELQKAFDENLFNKPLDAV